MKFPSYDRYVKSGEMSAEDAAACDAAREHGRISARDIPIGDHAFETVMLGVLDTIAGTLVRTYGPRAAAEMMHHYGKVIDRNAHKVPGQ